MKIDKKMLFFVLLIFTICASFSRAQYLERESRLHFRDPKLNDLKFPLDKLQRQFSKTNAGDSLNARLIGRWANGPCRAVAVSGDYAYFGNGCYLEIADVYNPANAVRLGKVVVPAPIRSVAVSDNYAYVALGYSGLRVIDVSSPNLPHEVGYVDTPDYALGVVVSGHYAYVAGDAAGLRVIDVSSPNNPQEVGYFDTPDRAWGIAVSGNYAYVADYYAGLRVINISSPNNPQEVGYVDTEGYAEAVAVSGNYAYVADAWTGLRIINISNPSNPREVGYFNTRGWAYDIAISGAYAYVADYHAGLRLINVSSPNNPQEVGYFDTAGDAYGVVVSSNYAYVADGWAGLRVIDVSSPNNPQQAGYVDTPGSANEVAVSGHYAYVADASAGLRVIDVASFNNPQEVGYFDTPGEVWGVAVSGNHAYVADYNAGLRVINVSNPGNPQEVGYVDTPRFAHGVAVSGHYAYVADASAGLRVINVSSPSNPQEVGYFNTPGVAHGVAVSGNYAYVAGDAAGLRVIDVSSPNHPQEVGYFDMRGYFFEVAVSGNYAYVVGGEAGLYIFEFFEPAAPTVATGAATNVTANSAQLNGSVNPNGLSTTVKFQYGTSTSYGSEANATPGSVSGTSVASVTAQLSEQLPNTTYHYRVVATNSKGTSYGADQSFTTLANPYLTVSPTSITIDSSANSQGSFSISSNVSWTVSDNAGWLDVSPTSGSGNATIMVTATSVNSSSNSRSATVMVSGGGYSLIVSVIQSGVRTGGNIISIVQNHSLHQEFYVDIQVKDAQNLFGVAFKLNFPADKLEALSAERGDFLGADPVFFPDVNNSIGVVSVGVSKKSGQPAANGTGIVARIKLKEKPSVISGITIDLSLTEITANDPSGNAITLTPQNTSYVTPGPNSVAERNIQVPEEYILYPTYPNPFNPTTTISYSLPKPGRVQLHIFDMNGRLVKKLYDGNQSAGIYTVDWNSKDELYKSVSSGLYLCRLVAGEIILYQKLILTK